MTTDSTTDTTTGFVDATPAQVLEGLPVVVSHCTACGCELHTRARITIYAYRLASDDRFSIARAYCRGGSCSPSVLVGTLGAYDVLATARLEAPARERRLVDVDTIQASTPNQGGKP